VTLNDSQPSIIVNFVAQCSLVGKGYARYLKLGVQFDRGQF